MEVQPSAEISAVIRLSQQAFHRDLPHLLRDSKCFRQWVAYHGEERIGFNISKRALYQECLRRGFNEQEILVRRILPQTAREIDSLNEV